MAQRIDEEVLLILPTTSQQVVRQTEVVQEDGRHAKPVRSRAPSNVLLVGRRDDQSRREKREDPIDGGRRVAAIRPATAEGFPGRDLEGVDLEFPSAHFRFLVADKVVLDVTVCLQRWD